MRINVSGYGVEGGTAEQCAAAFAHHAGGGTLAIAGPALRPWSLKLMRMRMDAGHPCRICVSLWGRQGVVRKSPSQNALIIFDECARVQA
jgi:hypothetical protein